MDFHNSKERETLFLIILGIVIFIAGTILTRHIGGGILALVIFILWRLGMLGIVVSWLIRVGNTVYKYLRGLVEVIKDEYF